VLPFEGGSWALVGLARVCVGGGGGRGGGHATAGQDDQPLCVTSKSLVYMWTVACLLRQVSPLYHYPSPGCCGHRANLPFLAPEL